jgi:hypothetical protein
MPTRSVLTFESHARARLQRLAFHARLHARTSKERAQVEQLCDAVLAGHVQATDAVAALRALRGAQQQAA